MTRGRYGDAWAGRSRGRNAIAMEVNFELSIFLIRIAMHVSGFLPCIAKENRNIKVIEKPEYRYGADPTRDLQECKWVSALSF